MQTSNLGQVTYYNQILDKKGTKKILSWFLDQYGPTRTSQFLEELKSVGFHFATLAGISLGFDDLKIPQKKVTLLQTAEEQIQACEQRFQQGKLTAVERYQKVIILWTTASENLKDEVIQSFQSTDLFNPLYMMAFSGARGNISQVRQLVGMRGLMSDSGGGIIDFPIRRNFREGLTVTEYAISCYGARKGLIDTALRTADSGYLTRRLVDVAHGIMIGRVECGTDESFEIAPLRVSKAETGFGKSGILLSLEKRILGRVLAQDVRLSEAEEFAKKNQEITPVLAHMICAKGSLAQHSLLIRSPLTCKHFQNFREDICQLCYGWSLSQGRLVSLGEAVGILAAQSIGEPGTQLTMRTFHTGGIFSTDVDAKIFAPHAGRVFYGSTAEGGYLSSAELPHKGKKIRTLDGETGFFLFEPLQLKIQALETAELARSVESIFFLPAQSIVFVYPGQKVKKNTLCAEISYFQQSDPSILLKRSAQQEPNLAQDEAASGFQPKPDSLRGLLHQKDSGPDIYLKKNKPEPRGRGHESPQLTQTRDGVKVSRADQKVEQTQVFISELDIFFASPDVRDSEDEKEAPGDGFIRERAPENEDENLSELTSSMQLPQTELSDTIQTKKVLSDIEGQIYFSDRQAGSMWVLSGSKTQFRGPVQTGDFFSSQSRSSLDQSNFAQVQLQQRQKLSSRCVNRAYEFTRLRKILPWTLNFTDENQSPPLLGNGIAALRASCHQGSELNQLCWWIFSLSFTAVTLSPQLTQNKEFQDNSKSAQLTQFPVSSIFLFSDSSRNFEDSKHPQFCFSSAESLNFLCFSQRRGSQTSKNRIRAQEKFKLPHQSNWCKQEKLKIFQKRLVAISFTQNQAWQKNTKIFLNSSAHPSAEVRHSTGRDSASGAGRNLKPSAADQPEEDPSYQKRKCFGEFRSWHPSRGPQVENSWLQSFDDCMASGAERAGLTLEKNDLRKIQPTLLAQTSSASPSPSPTSTSEALLAQIGQFLPARKNFKNTNLDTSVHLVMEASSKYCQTGSGSQTFRRVHPYLISKHSHIHVHDGEIVSSRQLLFELFFEQSKTGDIVQGLPKIEQLFEARRTSLHVQETIHKKLKQKYLELSKLHTSFEATFQSIRYIQRILIDEIQTVYQSQGVDIADKHLEIIVRQMTSKVVLHETKHTSFFSGDVVDFYKLINCFSTSQGSPSAPPKDITSEIMEPFVLGITKVAFLTESFISAASFQEAKRVLMDAALESRVDFLYGLKENVIVGRFIRAGTGFQVDVFPSYD